MRPGAILVSIVSLLLSLSVVVWLSHSTEGVDASTGLKEPAVADQPGTPRPSADTGPHPTADFAETRFDFGNVQLGDKGSHAFVVTNNGDAPLLLKAGESTCQCTVGEVGTQEVAPGESTTIELSWEIRNPAEIFEHSAIIHTNAPEHRKGEVRLIVSGRVIPELSVMPPETIDLGMITDKPASKFFVLYSRFHDSFELLSVDSPHESFSVEYTPLDPEELERLAAEFSVDVPVGLEDSAEDPSPRPKCGYRVTVTVDPSLPVGRFEIPLTLHTSLSNMPEFEQLVAARRPPPFQFFPLPGTRFSAEKLLVTTAAFDARDGAEMELLMLATGLDRPLEVSVVSTDPNWLEVTATADRSSRGVPRQRLKIRIPPGSPAIVRGIENPARIQLRTNHPEAEELNLDVTFLSR